MEKEEEIRAERSVIWFMIMGVFLFLILIVLYVVANLSMVVSVGIVFILGVIGIYFLLKRNKKE